MAVGNGHNNNNNAYYDPHSKCIKYDPNLLGGDNSGGGATLSGVIVDILSPYSDSDDIPFLRPGKLLMGEIIEIIDPSSSEAKEDASSSSWVDRDYDDYDYGPSAGGSAGGLLTRSFVETVQQNADASPSSSRSSKEELLQKQRQLQTLHAQQNQKLLRKHQKDRQWFHAQNLSEDRLVELETLHQKEVMELQTRQQREQGDMMDLIFSCMMMLIHRPVQHQQQQRVESLKEPPKESLKEPRAQPFYGASAVTVTSSTAVYTPSSVLPTHEASPIVLPYATGTTAAAASVDVVPAPPAASSIAASSSLPDRISTDRQKADEIKAVMRNRSLSREERQQKLAGIKERYNSATNTTTAATATAVASSAGNHHHDQSSKKPAAAVATMNDKSTGEQRRLELQSVMKDRSLGREEKQERMAEIQAKYAALSERQHNRQASQDKIEQMKARVAAAAFKQQQNRATVTVTSTSANDELENARQEFSPPSSESNNHNRSSAASVSSHASSSSSSYEMNADSNHMGGPVSEEEEKEEEEEEEETKRGEKAATRWNRSAVKVVTSNIVTKTAVVVVHDSATPLDDSNNPRGKSRVMTTTTAAEEEEQEQPTNNDLSDKERAAGRWNRAVVKTATSNIVAHTIDDSIRSSGVSSCHTDLVFDGPNHSSGTNKALTTTEQQQQQKPTHSVSVTESASNNTSQITIPEEDPLKDVPTDRTPMKKLIKKLNDDDPSLTILRLDGRKKIKKEDWELLFESLEGNSTLTHLSMARCELSNEMAVSLVLALVENETLAELRLNGNKSLTDDTAKGFIKVMLQSNKTLKKLEMARTKVTKKSMQKLKDLLEERDGQNKTAKVQEERQKKIKALLSFSAGDEVAKENATQVAENEEDDDDGGEVDGLDQKSHLSMSILSKQSRKSAAASVGSVRSGTSSKIANSSKASSRRRTARQGSEISKKNRSSSRSSSNTRSGRGAAGRGRRIGGRGGVRQSTVRASMTAQQMAKLGGDIANVGGDQTKLKEARKFRGECEVCGQKCYTKTMFKTTPLTIPNAVYEGRCLKCNPMM